MEADIPINLKRKCSSASQVKSSKRKRLQEPQLNILDLSDCALLHVLQFLDATSLYQLGATCVRFERLVQDESLWMHVEARHQPNDGDKLAFCWRNVHKKTRHLLVAGNQRSEVVLSLEALIGSDKLCNLTVLALEYQCIKYCTLSQFPSCLQELSFRHSYVARHAQFFRYAEASMSNLKTLILDHCQWFEAGSLTSIGKFPKLEILSLYMCKKLSEDDIGSVSLAGKFGFKSLKVVDLRFTGLGDLFIKTFYANPSVQSVYFQCFASTYYLERYKRKLDIIDGMKMREHSYVSDDEANNDTSKQSLTKRFQAVRLQQYNTHTIKDDTMITFNRLKKTGTHKMRPTSYLYTYPYEECNCGFFDKISGTYGFADSMKQDASDDDDQSCCSKECCQKRDLRKNNYRNSSSSSDSSGDEGNWDLNLLRHKLEREVRRQKRNRGCRQGGNIYFMCPPSNPICRNIVFDSCTVPDWCQVQSTPEACIQKWLYAREPRNDFEIAMFEHTDKHLQARATRGCGNPNSDCDCTDLEEEDTTVITVERNVDGSFVNITTRNRPVAVEDDVKKSQLNDGIKYLIKKTSDCIQKLKASRYPDNEAMTVVNEFLNTVDECLKREEFFKFFDDVNFIRQLCISFYQLSRSIKHDIYSVLYYHFLCFEDLLKKLQKNSSNAAKKNLFKRFFNNLLFSESQSTNFEEGALDLKHEGPDCTDENLNLPGPSGLQSSKIRTEYRCSRTKPRIYRDVLVSKDDSDSDTSTEFPRCGNTKLDRDSFQNSEERNGVERSNIKNALCPYIVNKRKYQLLLRLNNDSDADIDDNARAIRYMMYNVPVCVENVEINHLEPAAVPIMPIMGLDDIQLENVFIQVVRAPAERNIPTNMKELSFRGYPHVTDKTLMLLKEMDLDLLDVTGTNVTRLGVQQYMMYNPQCRLIHEVACSCRPKLHF